MAAPLFLQTYPLIMLLLGTSPGGDALDAIPTDVYWQTHGGAPTVQILEETLNPAAPATQDLDADIRDLAAEDFKTRTHAKQHLEAAGPAALDKLRPLVNSKDPDIAAVATELVAKAASSARALAVRKLMAIRTLGEKKEASALPMLAKLEASREMFVAGYVQRAEAEINGKPFTPVSHERDVEADAWLLPRQVEVVGQVKDLGLNPIVIQEVALDAANFATTRFMAPAANAASQPADTDSQIKDILGLLDGTGDFRVDGLTVGVAVEGEPFVELILHGQYDPDSLPQALDVAANARTDGIRSAAADEGMTILFPSDQRLVIVMGSTADAARLLHDEKKTGGLAENESLAAMVKVIDITMPVWAVAQPGANMQKVPVFAGVDKVTLTTKRADEGKITFEIAGEGQDADALKKTAEMVNTLAGSAATQMQAEMTSMTWERPGLTPLMELMQSIQAVADGTKARLTGEAAKNLTRFGEAGAAAMAAESRSMRQSQPQMRNVAPASQP